MTSYTNANILSIITFSWLTPLISLGNRKTLNLDDIPDVNPINSVVESLPILQTQLDSTTTTSNVVSQFTLAKALFTSAWKEFLWTGALSIVCNVARYTGPYLIDYFVQCLEHKEFRTRRGYALAFAFFASCFIDGITRKISQFKLEQVGIRVRASLAFLIYEKGLKLRIQSKQGEEDNNGVGEFVNLVAVDVDQINEFVVCIHDCWLIFFQIALGLGLLYKNLGLASMAALASTVFIMLSNLMFGSWYMRVQRNLMAAKDDRMKVTMETMKNMRILKLQGWETTFLSRILELRKTETSWLKKYVLSNAITNFVFAIAPTLVALATFGCAILLKAPLDAGKILSALATFRVFQIPIYKLPSWISSLVQMKVSLGRVALFLSLDELDTSLVEKLPYDGTSPNAIEITNGEFTWDDDNNPSHVITLRNINLIVPNGTKVAIVGRVGSGKSSLISSILGEMYKTMGRVVVCGTTVYVAQTPWIKSGTIEDNILFGKYMDRDGYDKVIEACCLNDDLKIMSFGDQTIIGERGINLSGGQKQRIQIARAVYHGADTYLFDDPFSALDAHTGSHLYNEVLLGLLKEKTVLYVTHQVEFLSEADVVVVMKDGMIAQMGKYNDLKQLIGAQCVTPPMAHEPANEPESESESSLNVIFKPETIEPETEPGSSSSSIITQVINDEEREKGSVGFTVFYKYLTVAYGGALVVLVFLTRIISVTLEILSYYWLAWAARASSTRAVTRSKLIFVYAAIALGISVSMLAVDTLVATIAYATATILFRKMLRCVFRAPMSFFDATPSGRFLSRCSTDQSAIETQVPTLIEDVYSSILELLGIVVVMATVAWPVLIVFVPVIFFSVWYQRYYMPSARELSRLNGICEAPVTQHFVETISGCTTIRSFDKQVSFGVTYMKILDTYSRIDFHLDAAMKWLLFRQDALAFTTFASLLIFLVTFAQNINPAIAGLAVSYGLTLSNALTALVWNLCYCGTKMISVERILQYTVIPSEAPLVIDSNRPHSSWPSNGEIRIIDLKIRYARHLPIVLHGLTCTFPARKRIGIVGRTGSGKSTLVQALLRIVEPTTGHIIIDGIDISTIGLQDLRSKLGIIPQEPVMFQGTIRSNLDPLQQYTDLQLWEALDKCELGDGIRMMEKKLESDVVENGENWSMGQRQLLCLGRVLLKKCRVLLLDEATASVDGATDNLIQRRIRENFYDSTTITIAHRMTSVLDGDLVLLLSNGRIEEFDNPNKLLENKSSSFAKLVAAWSNLRNP